jgi:hypothetical protein
MGKSAAGYGGKQPETKLEVHRSAKLAHSLGRKPRALLAYLVANDRPSSRDELCAIFWPDSEPARSRHSLRQTLVSIRKALGEELADCLITDGDDVSLNPSVIKTDLDEFATYEAGGANNPEALLSILNGPLLQGVSRDRRDSRTGWPNCGRNSPAARSGFLRRHSIATERRSPTTRWQY